MLGQITFKTVRYLSHFFNNLTRGDTNQLSAFYLIILCDGFISLFGYCDLSVQKHGFPIATY